MLTLSLRRKALLLLLAAVLALPWPSAALAASPEAPAKVQAPTASSALRNTIAHGGAFFPERTGRRSWQRS